MNGKSSAFEHYAFSIVAAIILGVLFWVAYTTQQTAVGVAQLQEVTQSVKERLTRLERYHERGEW